MPDINPIEESLGRIEVAIRQLKVQYDMFFSGVIPRQPFELRKDLEILIKTLGNTPMQRFADRYRYNALASKYQTMVELWNKMIRAKEEGRLRPGIPGFVEPVRRQAAAAQAAAQGRSASSNGRRTGRSGGGEGATVVFRQSLSASRGEDGSLRVFYDKFLEATRTSSSGNAREVSYEQFARQIAARTDSVRRKAGCESVTFSIVVRDGGVTLKAIPTGGRSET